MRQLLLQSASLLRQNLLPSAGCLLLSELISSIIALISMIQISWCFSFTEHCYLAPCWRHEGESVLFTTIQPVSSSVSNDLLRDEVSMCTKPPALTTTSHCNLCTLPVFFTAQNSHGCNMCRERRENSGNQKRELFLVVLMAALY